MSLFRLKRKQALVEGTRQRKPYRAVDSVERIGTGEATCIKVGSPDHLFLTGEFIPTHNTVILLGAIARLDQPAMVVVHSTPLKEQWEFAASRWLGVVPGTIGAGKKMRLAPLTVATQQALWAMVKKGKTSWADGFGTFVGDEIHRWAARTFAEVANTFAAAYRIGASADERRKDGMEHVVYETFGSRVYKIKRDALVDDGKLLPVEVEVLPTGYRDAIYLASVETSKVCPQCRGPLATPPLRKKGDRRRFCPDCKLEIDPEIPDWRGMIDRLVLDRTRNELIREKVLRVLNDDPDHRILILSERVDACRRMAARLVLEDVPAGLLLGGPENKAEFARTISGINTGKLRVAVGTTVADEGLDLPPLTHVFVTCPLHTNPKRLKQMAGRAARPHGKARWATCVYFWDREMFPPQWDGRDLADHKRDEDAFLRRLKRNFDRLRVFAGSV
jgi:superfamily II DNA or RNA helicase